MLQCITYPAYYFCNQSHLIASNYIDAGIRLFTQLCNRNKPASILPRRPNKNKGILHTECEQSRDRLVWYPGSGIRVVTYSGYF